MKNKTILLLMLINLIFAKNLFISQYNILQFDSIFKEYEKNLTKETQQKAEKILKKQLERFNMPIDAKEYEKYIKTYEKKVKKNLDAKLKQALNEYNMTGILPDIKVKDLEKELENISNLTFSDAIYQTVFGNFGNNAISSYTGFGKCCCVFFINKKIKETIKYVQKNINKEIINIKKTTGLLKKENQLIKERGLSWGQGIYGKIIKGEMVESLQFPEAIHTLNKLNAQEVLLKKAVLINAKSLITNNKEILVKAKE